jgi:hypothetical protein
MVGYCDFSPCTHCGKVAGEGLGERVDELALDFQPMISGIVLGQAEADWHRRGPQFA